LALPLFAITLFVSAFLLFLVQPMIGKLVLPKLGGTPQVWNTCMVFFQSVLLLGYAYTHSVSTRLKLRQQLVLHGILLVIPIGLILWHPFYETVHGWTPPAGSNPIPQTLLLLAIVVGIPFFVVSTSAPLLQKWFAYSGDKAAQDPYFLYGASNLGSLLSLLAYPALVEPWTELPQQSVIWLVGYVALAGLIGYCAYMIYKLAPPDSVLEAQAALATASASANEAPPPAAPSEPPPPAPAPVTPAQASTAVKPGPGPSARSISRKKGKHHHGGGGPAQAPTKTDEPSIARQAPAPLVATGATAPMTNWRRIRWVLLAAVPSSLMLGVTSYISTDLSPFPLVWVIPLALYLLAFILVFMKPWTEKRFQILSGQYTLHEMVLYVAQPLGLIVLCFVVLSHKFEPFWITSLLMFGFFATALACHGELAFDRPSTRHLTEYFLWMSVGGMIGGMFNGIIAPIVFQTGVWEFHVAIVIACFIRPQYNPSGWFDDLILNAFPGLQNWSRNQGNEMAKSFGKPAPNTTYLFSLILDILLGLFILAISYWLITKFVHPLTKTTIGVAQFLQLPVKEEPRTLAERLATEKWTSITFNVFVYFIPMIFCFFFAGRPLRFGLAMAGLLLGNLYFPERSERIPLESRRTYFGLLRVQQDTEGVRNRQEYDLFRNPDQPELKNKDGELISIPYPFTFLMHGTTYHGRNYYRDYNDEFQKYRIDLSRLATTYYHRYGPVGVVMEPYNWLAMPAKKPVLTDEEKKRRREANPGAQNDFSADMRMPATMIGQAMGSFGLGEFPMPMLVNAWSEPPLATIGLGTGTMASYGRPYGWVTYYEIDDVIRGFSLPEGGGEARFTYLQNAIRRGVNLEVLMGDARQTLEREANNFDNSFVFYGDFKMPKLGEKYPYANAPYNSDRQVKCVSPHRDGFYKVIVVDAFSSDAIPIHLVTKQAIALYMSKLTQDGVLCVHTSNRHMDLVRPVARIVMELSKEAEKKGELPINCLVGKDSDKGKFMGLFSSEYVMVYRGDGFKKHVDNLQAKRREFIQNFETVKNNPAKAEEMDKDGKFRMDVLAPDGWQILNSSVEWYDPFQNVEHPQFGRLHQAVTPRDSLWTDDYSYILGVLR
jgi:hypothetical protein